MNPDTRIPEDAKSSRAPVVVLMGPTAAGKTALGLQLAKEFNGEIVNADSRQIYIGMDIGTAKPPFSERRKKKEPHFAHRASQGRERRKGPDEAVLVEGVPHYLTDILTPHQTYSAAAFRDDATRIIAEIHRRGKLPIVVGGTGFYIRALTGEQTLPNVPADPAFRAWAALQPVNSLAAGLKRLAPGLHARVDNLQNRRRVTRFLEIARAQKTIASRPISYKLEAISWLKLALVPPRDVLRQRVAARVDEMFQRGFVNEVRQLVHRYGAEAPGLQTTGYREIVRGLRDGWSEAQLQEGVARAHWETARRQLTWLRREPRARVVETADTARAAVRTFLTAK